MSQAVQCQMLTWEQIYHLARLLSRRIRESNYRIDLMVAIGRGGYIPARILSDMLGVSNLTGFKIEHYRDIRKTQQAVVRYPLTADVAGKNVLLVDDVTDTGDTFDAAIEHIRQRGAFKEIRTAALIHKTVSRFVPDYYADCLAEWRWQIFPWAVN
ncbi:MAG: phosphoribosyltransferase, partial [Gammaproteobacteria bacterium]